ncbi:MAG TPA: heparinase II/III family protein, partial [Methanocella sp.]|nr:heparinase II/III family protein [Methanocella sp.]
HMDKNSVYQVFREGWANDSDWLSLVTFNGDVPTYSWRNTEHHDQMSVEYYAKGDLLLADGGEDRYVLDKTYGRGEASHNTIAIEDPRKPFAVSTWADSPARGMFKGTRLGIDTPSNIKNLVQAPWLEMVDVNATISKVQYDFDTSQDLTTPVRYERTIMYPDKDYMIAVDRLEGTQAWGYRTIFRPSGLSIDPTVDLNGDGQYTGNDIGHVNGDLAIGGSPYNWLSMGFKTETATGINTSLVGWGTTNPYGQAVNLQIYSVPSSEILVTKLAGRVGGQDPASEVLGPVVYYRTAPTTSLYRATVLLPAYAAEAKRTAQTTPVVGKGNAIKVGGPGYTDYVYTGKGTSYFASYKTDADTAFIRARNGAAAEITFMAGSFMNYSGTSLIALSGKADYFTYSRSGNGFSFRIKSAGAGDVAISKLDPTAKGYTVLKDGAPYSGWTLVDSQTMRVTNGGGEHKYDITWS